MAEVAAHDDLLEQILERLDVKDLIRYKIVCKSWHSLITSHRFVNRHLNRSYNKDRDNSVLRARRFALNTSSGFFDHRHLVGSSNGLVCIIFWYHSKLLVGNPLTREVRKLESPPWIVGLSLLCLGFGYDSLKDDYKVIVGAPKGANETCVYALSLKTNAWRVIGEVKHTFIRKIGMLCNGALHWIVEEQNRKKLILSYDLSKEQFKEIPQPEDARYDLGGIEERLCMFRRSQSSSVVIINNKVLEVSGYDSYGMKYDIVHFLSLPKDKSSFFHDETSWFASTSQHAYRRSYVEAPIFVQSLVSPHVNRRSLTKRQTRLNKKSGKLINQGKSFFSWTKCASSTAVEVVKMTE